MTSPALRPLHVLAGELRSRRLRAAELVGDCFARIRDDNKAINAFITVLEESARADAETADREMDHGTYRGPLHGIPVSIKDLIDVAGVPTTAASHVRAGHVAAADAPVVARLRQAGAVLVGKTNLHEFAFGTTSEESAFGAVRNPIDPSRSAGGSSGGSAAALVAGMCVASLGTDTGGSIRIPSSACGTVGLKPTLGEVPIDGVVPLSTTMDHVGPMTRNVMDAAIVFDALMGRAPSECPTEGTRFHFGVPEPFYLERLDPEVRARFDEACARLREAGHRIDSVAIAHAEFVAPVYLHVVMAEAAAYHAVTLEAMPEKYVPSIRMRLEMGKYVLGEDYVRAMRGRDVLRASVDAAIGGRTALILPTLPIPAPPVGAASIDVGGTKEPLRAVMLRLTQTFNLTGHPAISLPMGVTSSGLPCGFPMVGRRGATSELLRVALASEAQITPGSGSVGGGAGGTSGSLRVGSPGR